MIPSKYNNIFELDQDHYVFVNLLSGACDVGDKLDKQVLESNKPRDEKEKQNWLERGYFFNTPREEKLYTAERYAEFMKANQTNETQFLLVPTYGCNFNCAYCYQKGIESASPVVSADMLEAFLRFVVDYRDREKRQVMVTLFGGEPLLLGNKPLVQRLVKLLKAENISLSVVTNGYYLTEYIDILKDVTIREIHVSLDGDREEHDRRRSTRNGLGSFDRILSGLKLAREAGFPINIRLILDRITLPTLPALATTLEKEGFFSLPVGQLKTSLGRNYELINDYMKPDDLFSLDEMIREYVKLMAIHPLLRKLHLPSFFGISQLVTKGEMYMPSYDTCPAGKSEYVFDASGNIFGCTASCGRKGYEIGTYYPSISWNEGELKQWQERSILTIPECQDCAVGVVCGGGCGVISKDRTGKVKAPNCKPIKEVMQEGVHFYKDFFLSDNK